MAEVLVESPQREQTVSWVRAVRLRRIVRPVLLVLILAVAAWFRFTALDWDQGRHLHPDERYITVLASELKSPPSLNAYFDSGASTLNPFNTDWGRSYVYGTLPLFAGRYLGEYMDRGCGPTPGAIPQFLGQLLFGADVKNCPIGTFTGYDYIGLLGRIWSGASDLLAVFVLFLIGRRLFGWRVGLLAAALSAAAVLQIQQGHYFTVDSTANLFVVLTLWFCILLAVDDSPWTPGRKTRFLLYGLLAGVSAGCAIASKISVWPLVPLIIASLLVALARDRRVGFTPLVYSAVALVLAGIGTFGSFRVAQPYAFVGNSNSEFALTLQRCSQFDPKDALARVCKLGAGLPAPIRELVAPSARWIEQINLAQGFVNGTIDAPFAHQWTNRTPIVFPLINLVFWGLGLPLGIAACIGFLYALRQLLRGRRWWAYIIPVSWAGLYFLYQSTQWTKSMRYLLPVYPTLSLCAAIGLIALWRTYRPTLKLASNVRWVQLPSWFARSAPLIVIALVLIGNLVWAMAFMQIYGEPITRVTASRWAYQNIPTALTLRWQHAQSPDQADQLQLAVKQLILQPGAAQTIPFKLEQASDGWMANLQLVLNHELGAGQVQASLIGSDGSNALRTTQQAIDPNHTVITFGAANLRLDTQYFIALELKSGGNVIARTSTVANEHWDDAVPQPIDGKDAYGNYYNGLKSSSDGQIQNYNEDTPDKLPQVLNWLDEADYLVMSSNRLYGSIPRLPWRFPMTTEYYRAMFNGELGFELVADFSSFPRIGPFVFNDQEMPQFLRRTSDTQGTPSGIQVPYPTAEEAFSVYDHPRVLIFKKTAVYSRSLAEQVLGKYDLTRTIQQTPLKAVNTPHGMLFDDITRLAQQAGGTWSELFPRTSLLNQSQPLTVLAWLVLLEVLGLAVFPIIALSTNAVRGKSTYVAALVDGGYSFAKILALLLVAFVAWWLSSTKVTQYTALQLWAIIGVLVVIGGVLWMRYRETLLGLVRSRAPLIIASEVVFLTAFALFLVVRIGNPDLWHPYMGGEKPMDFAYLNGVLKSSYFPPIDPWFAGGYINYYYFGFVVVSTPIKALGIDPSVAYNIVIPMLYGLTAAGAFGLGATLYARLSSRGRTLNGQPLRMSSAILAGVLATLFVVGLGNLRELDVYLPAWQQLGGVKNGVAPLGATLAGFVKWIRGADLPIYPNWPYWNPTRPTAGLPVDSVQIAEFPLFTFLYADLHAHMMAMPLAYLALAFGLAYAAGARKWPAILLGAIVVGSLWPTNSWDYPVYLLVCIAAIVIDVVHQAPEPVTASTVFRRLLSIIPVLVVFVVLTRAFYIPYLDNYGSAYNSIEPWTNERTPLDVYFTIYGLFMVPIVTYLLWGIWRNFRYSTRRFQAGLVFGLIAFLAAVILAYRGVPIMIVALPIVALAFLAAIMPGTATQTRILWFLTAGAMALTVFVELFTLRGDIGRMNTVFKFYIQAWLILGVTSGVILVWVLDQIREQFNRNDVEAKVVHYGLQPVFAAVTAFVVFLAAMYPLFAIPAKMRDRYVANAPHTLDGMVYMTRATRDEGNDNKTRTFPLVDDYLAIKWMQDNVIGSPTIIEGTTGPNLYRWGNRFSIYTGLPAVVGWQWHERQQRAALDDSIVYDRDTDLTTFYSTPDIAQALMLIRRYNARYVILGQLEQAYYDQAGIPKFSEMVTDGFLRIAYQNGGTIVYEVNTGAVSSGFPITQGTPGSHNTN